MNTLTKEWLQNTITSIESARDEIPFGLDEDQNNMLTALKIALASLATASDERAAYELFMEKRFGDSVDRRRAKNGDNEYMAWDIALGWVVWQQRSGMSLSTAQPQEVN
ncbi:DNA-binding protein [Escherichia coli]|nr:DNA-binding protein [Escherichia coli]EKE4268189.1 DNA-binding protein [Escherichia coli]MBI0687991.1 DNA-binding protein [Escherichia coli]HBP8997815.1 DNA-binding protein [Escherichia coli]